MTQIDFYFNAADKLKLAATLSSKAVAQFLSGIPHTRMFLFTPDEATTQRVEAALWTFQQTSFLPHCRGEDRNAHETPIIVGHGVDHPLHDEVLLNLCPQYPAFFSRFRRLIEIVGTGEEDKSAARERFRFYRDRGYEIRSHDVTGRA
jgi:DNA polymerase-3 subunit chi